MNWRNDWSKDEIILTRRAWRLYDADRASKAEYKFVCVSWCVSIVAVAIIVWIAI